MTFTFPRTYLHSLTDDELVSTNKPLTKKKRRSWKKHVKDATAHVEELIIQTAQTGRRKFVMEGFSSRSPISLRKDWKLRSAEYSSINTNMYPNTGIYISERCVDDIVSNLRMSFPDSNITHLYIKAIEEWGSPTSTLLHFLVVDWS